VTMWSQRGDVDDDGVINVVDVVFLLNYIFIDGPAPDPPCLGDVNKDGNENSDDVLYLISYLFLGGPPPKILLAPSR
ncbi:MAG: dockerin type I repeat-containing protein, partial [candidate division Zixibacteria bacterium]|nr:dockerin type I repeat-containing protein [candidate division Zixibacteria bacterium]